MMDVKTTALGPSSNVEPKRKCTACARAPVCQILRVYSEYNNKEFVEKKVEQPFPPERLAELCRYFLPTAAIRLSATPEEPTN